MKARLLWRQQNTFILCKVSLDSSVFGVGAIINYLMGLAIVSHTVKKIIELNTPVIVSITELLEKPLSQN